MTPDKDPYAWLPGAFYLSILAALFGRLTWLGEGLGRGRRFWKWSLLFELPTAFCMALIGSGIAEYFALGTWGALGLISGLSYLGPRSMLERAERLIASERKNVMKHIDAMITDVIRREGGYVNHPADKGGPTKYGITHKTLAAWRGRSVSADDVKAMKEDEARAIYRTLYFTQRGLNGCRR